MRAQAPSPKPDHTVSLWETGDGPFPAIAIVAWAVPMAGLTLSFSSVVESSLVFIFVLFAGTTAAILPLVIVLTPRKFPVQIRVRPAGLLIRPMSPDAPIEGYLPWSTVTAQERRGTLRIHREGGTTIVLGGPQLPALVADLADSGLTTE